MTGTELIGAVAALYLRDRLSGNDGEGTARFIIDALTAEQTAAIARAVINDTQLAADIELKLPEHFLRGFGLPDAILTKERATYYRNAYCARNALLLANTGDDEIQSLKELVPIGAAQLAEEARLWIEVASAGVALTDEQKVWWEKALLGLHGLHVFSLDRVAEYIIETQAAIRDEGETLIKALGASLPALHMPRDSVLFTTLKPTALRQPSRWKRAYSDAYNQRTSYLRKQTPSQSLLTSEDLRQAFIRVQESIPEYCHLRVQAFIDAPSGWNPAAADLATCEWETIKPLFDGLKRARFNLGEETKAFYDEREPELLSNGEREYLARLAEARRLSEPQDEDRQFYEAHRNELKEDPKLKSNWDRFVFGTPRESEDFLTGLALCMEALFAQQPLSRSRTLTIRCDRATKRDLKGLNVDAGRYFAHRYRGLRSLLGSQVQWQVGQLFDFDDLLEEWQSKEVALNRSSARAALQLKFTLYLEVEQLTGGTEIYNAQLIWKYNPSQVLSEFVNDWARLVKHPLVSCTVARKMSGRKGRAQSVDLSDVRTLSPVYGQDYGSFVAAYKKRDDIAVLWRANLDRAVQEQLIGSATAGTLSQAFQTFQECYAAAIQGFAQRGLACSELEEQLTVYGNLLERICLDARGDKNRELLLRPLLGVGTVQVQGGRETAIVAPWHPLRLAAISRKAHLVADLIRSLLSREQIQFGDTRMYFQDLVQELQHPFYPEVVLGWHGDKAVLLSLTDIVGDYSLHEPPIASRTAWDDTNENPLPAANTVLDLVGRYLTLYPHKQANLSVVLYNCDSARLPQAVVDKIASVYEDEEDVRCQVILRHRDEKRLRSLYERIVEMSDTNPDAFSASEAQQDFMARLRIAILADQAPAPTPQDGCFADIAFSQDVIARHAHLEWYYETANPLPVAQLVPPRWSRRRAAAKDDMKSVVYLCCPVQSIEGWSFLTALTTFIKGDWDGDTSRRLLPARQLDFQDPDMASIFADTHNLATWVVNYDELLDRRQLMNQGVQVIRYKQSATQGRNIVISSTASLDLLHQMVLGRLRDLNLEVDEQTYQDLVRRFIADANGISGDIVLRAAKHGRNASELMGIVLSRYLIQHELGLSRHYGWYFLDDYADWLGQREEQIADILALSPESLPDGRLRLAIMVSEAKYIDASGVSAKRKESQKQLRDTVARVNDALFGDPERLDRDLWLARLSDLILDGVQFPASARINLADWRRAIREGKCEVYVRGYSHVFVSGPVAAPDCSDFARVAGLDNAFQEVFDRSRVRRLVLSYLRNESPLVIREEIAEEPVWRHQVYQRPVDRVLVDVLTRDPLSAADVDDPDELASGDDADSGDSSYVPPGPRDPSASPHGAVPPTPHKEEVGESMRGQSEEGGEIRDAAVGGWAYPGIASLLAQQGPSHGRDEVDRVWLHEIESRTKAALQQFQMRSKLVESILTPNAALLKFAGSEDLTVELVSKRRSQLLTTFGLNIISIQPEAGVVSLAIERPKRQVVLLSDLWRQWSPDCTDGNQELLIATRESNGELLYLAPGAGHAPHTLIAGSTGSGKSVLLQNIILAIAATNLPSQARLILIDPKQGVDYFQFDALPHLDGGIIDQVDTALDRLHVLVQEMDARYSKFKAARAPNLKAYNQKVPQAERLPVIWLIHDEFAEWMMIDEYKQEVTSMVSRLGVKARAAGIYLIFAAQRPDANVMPMQLRANLGNRLILRVDSEGTSELALGDKGAERLLGRGHLLAKLEGEPLYYAQVPFTEEAFMERLISLIE